MQIRWLRKVSENTEVLLKKFPPPAG
jgi:hypothetical protein